MRPGGIQELPQVVPVFPLPGALLLPFGELPLNIFEPRYLAMCDDALAGARLIGMIQPLDPDSSDPAPALCRVGCAGRITSFRETLDNRYLIALTGLCRFAAAEELAPRSGYRRLRADWSAYRADFRTPDAECAPRGRLLPALRDYCRARGLKADWKAIEGASGAQLVTALSMLCPFGPREKQALLESPDLAGRAELMISLMTMAALERDESSAALN